MIHQFLCVQLFCDNVNMPGRGTLCTGGQSIKGVKMCLQVLGISSTCSQK